MKILIVSVHGNKTVGGVQQACANLALGLSRLPDTSVTWAANAASLPDEMGNVRLLPLLTMPNDTTEEYGGWAYAFLPKNVRALLALRSAVPSFDVVHVHEASYVTCFLAAYWAKKNGIPFVLTHHNNPLRTISTKRLLDPFRHFLEAYTMRNAEKLIYVSKQQERMLGEKHPGTVLLCGYDADMFRFDDASASESKRAVGWDDRPTLLYSGRLSNGKRIEIIKHIAAAHPEWNIVFVGQGPKHPAEWKLGNVLTLPPPDDRFRLVEYYRAADLLLLPTEGEGVPLTLMEALGCGLPVVTSTIACPQDTLPEGTYRCVNDTDIADEAAAALWAEQIERMLRPRELQELREYVRTHPTGITCQHSTRTYRALYDSIVLGKRNRR